MVCRSAVQPTGNFTGGERGVDGQTREDLAGVHAHHANLVNARDGGFKLEQDAVLVEGRALLHGDAAGPDARPRR